jgi:hypothetical protein
MDAAKAQNWAVESKYEADSSILESNGTMVVDWWLGKELEGSCCYLVEVLSWQVREVWEKSTKRRPR